MRLGSGRDGMRGSGSWLRSGAGECAGAACVCQSFPTRETGRSAARRGGRDRLVLRACAPRARRQQETTMANTRNDPRRTEGEDQREQLRRVRERRPPSSSPAATRDAANRRARSSRSRRSARTRSRSAASIPEPLAAPRLAASAGQASCCRVTRSRLLQELLIARWRSLLGFGWAAVAFGPTSVLAGLSLDEAIARHRALVAPPGRRRTGRADADRRSLTEGGDDVTAAVGGHGDDIPAAASRPRSAAKAACACAPAQMPRRRCSPRPLRRDLAARRQLLDLVRWHRDQRAARRRPRSTPRSSGATGARRGPAA